MQKPTWIIFDVGGVLLDWRTGAKDAAELLSIEQELVLEAIYQYLDDIALGKLSIQEVWAKILKDLQKDHDPEDVVAAWHQTKNWVQASTHLIEELSNAGYNIALLTNGVRGSEAYNRHIWNSPFIKHIFDSIELNFKKPDPEIYQHVEEKLGSRGSELFFIDDSQKNLIAAEEFGWQTFLYDLGSDQGETANNKLREMLLNKEN